jgi:hypothetical protein
MEERNQKKLSPKERKKQGEEARKYHEQSVLVLTFLGGVAFTGLVLILNEKPNLVGQSLTFGINGTIYFEFLTFWLGLVSALCVMVAIAAQRMVARWTDFGTTSDWFASWGYFGVALAFLFALVLILFPFAPWAALFLLLIGTTIGVTIWRSPKKSQEQTPSESGTSEPTTPQTQQPATTSERTKEGQAS